MTVNEQVSSLGGTKPRGTLVLQSAGFIVVQMDDWSVTLDMSAITTSRQVVFPDADVVLGGAPSPDSFSFTDQTGVGLNSVTTSNTITLSGDSSAVWPITIRGSGSPQLQVNSGSWTISGHVIAGDTVTVRLTSSGSTATELTATLHAPGLAIPFNVTTSGVALDGDAVAFLSATSITDATITTAINDLVVALKAASLWSLFAAVYPFVGGTATTHKYNLVNPVDSDGAFRLSFNGSWSHNANGIAGDGSTTWADTHFVCSTGFTSAASGAFGIYSRVNNNTGSTPYDMSASNGTDTQACLVIVRYSNDTTYCNYGSSTYAPSTGGLSGAGMFTCSRTNGSTTTGYRNATQLFDTTDAVSLPAYSLYIGASNKGGSASYFATRGWAFAFICPSGLNSTQVSDLYTAVQAFQTTLSRQV